MLFWCIYTRFKDEKLDEIIFESVNLLSYISRLYQCNLILFDKIQLNKIKCIILNYFASLFF
jgi:hypothetical protein